MSFSERLAELDNAVLGAPKAVPAEKDVRGGKIVILLGILVIAVAISLAETAGSAYLGGLGAGVGMIAGGVIRIRTAGRYTR